MLDRITIRDMEIYANHGVFPEENFLGQKFLVTATLYTSTREAGKTDQLTTSIHYGEVCHHIQRFLKEHTYQLLESCVEQLAVSLLLEFPRIETIELEIKKPWAPIGLPLDTVSVAIRRGWHTAFIALGSNLGDSKGYLDFAVKQLGSIQECQVVQVSDYITTKPYGGIEQPDFLNAALELRTMLEPEELLEFLHSIEQAANRERIVHWGPRTLDLDILLYDNLVYDSPTLHIPHAELHLRDFVLVPMCQLAPWKRHPLKQETMAQLMARLRPTVL